MTTRRLDAKGLRALAHPLRVRMLSTLRTDGPATATQLAERLGESTGTTSWHLRQLAAHGFIEEDPDRGNRRDRWWRTRYGSTQLTVTDFADRPELQGSLAVYLHSVVEHEFRQVADFLADDRWPLEWRDATTMSDFLLRLTPEGLRALNAELFEVIGRHQAEAAEAAEATGSAGTTGAAGSAGAAQTAGSADAAETGARTVVVQLQSFPLRGGAG